MANKNQTSVLADWIADWIPVEESLPVLTAESSRVTCIVAYKDGQVGVLDYCYKPYARSARAPRWEWHFRIEHRQVTHWMPLPEGPKA